MDSPPGERLEGETAGSPSQPETGPIEFEDVAGDARPHDEQSGPLPWPLPADAVDPEAAPPPRKPGASTQKRLFKYPDTPPGSDARKHGRAGRAVYADGDSDEDSENDLKASLRSRAPSTRDKALASPRVSSGWVKAQAPGGPSSIVNPLALMSLRKHPPPPPPPTSRHVPNIADIGASLVEEATVMMKHRLAEHTLSNLAARTSEEFFQKTFYRWRQVVQDERNYLIRANRALDRLCLRVQRRAMLSWQDTCVWSRIIENLARVAVTRNWTKCKRLALSGWIDHRQRLQHLALITKRADTKCVRSIVRKWVMCSRISRVRTIQLVRLWERKKNRLLRESFAAYVDAHRADKSLYLLNRLVQKTAIVSGAVILRAWREYIECNAHLEKAGNMLARRWELLEKREVFKEWIGVWTFNRTAAHAAFAIAGKSDRRAQHDALSAWVLAQHRSALMKCAGRRIANKNGLQLAAKAWKRWVEARTTSRRLQLCYNVIRTKFAMVEGYAKVFDGWKGVLDDSRRLQTADRKFQWHSWQLSGQVLMCWRRAARRLKKLGLWHTCTDRRLKRIWLKNCFSDWQQRSLGYFRSWRKSERLKARFSSSLVALHWHTWKDKVRSKTCTVLFAAKINTRVLGNCVQAWSARSHNQLARAGRTEQGVHRLSATRAFRVQVECMDIWYAKLSCRKRVDEIARINEEKTRKLLMDKFFAEMMRQQDDFVFRQGQLRKNFRTRRTRLMAKTMACFARNREDNRTDAHRTIHIRFRLETNLCSTVFKRWTDVWAISQVKGKLYYGLVARGDFRVAAWSFKKWREWLQIRSEQEQKVAKALWLNIPRYQASWVLATWTDKHRRTMHFERLVLGWYRKCCQRAFDCWYDSIKDALLQVNCLARLSSRLSSKSVRYYFELWHEHTVWAMFSNLAVGRAQQSTARSQLKKAVSIWGTSARALGKLRSRMSIFALRMKATATACIFAAWNDHRLDWTRRVKDLSIIIRRALASSLMNHFLGWKAVSGAERLRRLRLQNVYARLFQSEVRASLTRWREMTYDTGLLLRKYLHLDAVSREHLTQRCFAALKFNVAAWKDAARKVMRHWKQSVLAAAGQVLMRWRDHFYFVRKAKKVLTLAFQRNDEAMQFKSFASWTAQMRKHKRLDRQMRVWDQREASEFFEEWRGFLLHNKSCRCRAYLMCVRSARKACNQVFLFWAYYSSAQNTRRIKMIRLRTRFDMRQLQRAFVQLNESALVRRRRRQMLAKTAAAVQRSKVSNAAARLLEHSKTCLRRRRVFQMLLKRHQSKLIQHAWGEWEMRMESKKRMQLAYQKALEMD